jgi:hypothetical protein
MEQPMVVANSSNDAALNAQLDITRDASIANLEQKSSEVQQQYRDEAAKIQEQKQRSAEVVQGTIDAARENEAQKAEADFRQASENLQAVENAVFKHIDAPADGSPKRLNYNRLTGVPLNLEGDLIRTTQLALKARDAYLDTHPSERDNPMLQARLGEDGFVKDGSELQQQRAIASPGVQHQVNPNEPLVTFIDQPDGKVTMKLATGETFPDLPNQNRDALRRLGESKVNTRRHYENLAQQQQAANGQQPQAQPQHADQSLTDWFLDETAKRFGYQNGNEMVADQNARYQREQKNNEVLEQYKNQNTVSQFFMEHPDYPNTDQANNALETIINRNGWEWTPDSMAAAHALAVQNRVYQPLSHHEIQVANGYASEARRPTPPPMLKGGNPETQTSNFDPWTAKDSATIRKEYFAELERQKG